MVASLIVRTWVPRSPASRPRRAPGDRGTREVGWWDANGRRCGSGRTSGLPGRPGVTAAMAPRRERTETRADGAVPVPEDPAKWVRDADAVVSVAATQVPIGEVMGATDPKKATAGTIRHDFAESIEANSVHGSDSPENAAVEIAFFFAAIDICP